jgi:hypothetical protein
VERISRLDVSKLCRPPRHISPDQAASASPNAGAVCFDGTPGGSHNFPLGLLSGLIPGRASVGSPGYPSLTTAILALDRIGFATGLHRLHYRRKSGAIACRTFVLDRFHGWLSHLNLSGARLSWAFMRSLSARSSCSPSPLLDIILKGHSVGGCVPWATR